MILHGLHGGIIKWIWQFRWLQVRYKRLMYRYLLGFCVRVFLVRVLSHLTLFNIQFSVAFLCIGEVTVNERRQPRCLGHGTPCAWLQSCICNWRGRRKRASRTVGLRLCAGVTCFPLSSQGQVGIQDCSLVGLTLAPRGCTHLLLGVRNGGRYTFAYNW